MGRGGLPDVVTGVGARLRRCTGGRVSRALATAMAAVIGAGGAFGAPAQARSHDGFEVGAADADITPPALDTPAGRALDAELFVPACGSSVAEVHRLWPGPRRFAFEEPYVDVAKAGRYVPGDPYCDAAHLGRYQAPYLAGGSGVNRWPVYSADAATNSPATRLDTPLVTDDPIEAHAVVFAVRGRRAAMVSVDSIGLFNTTMDAIRERVARAVSDLTPSDIFISSTHDESAPDPIGLWGPNLSGYPSPVARLGDQLPAGVTSGVDEYYMNYLVEKVAQAIIRADRQVRPARLKLVVARMPANTQSCWSSYPFVDTNLMPVMQAVSTSGRVIFTMVNVGTHDETLAFSGNPAYAAMLSGDWTGRLSAWLRTYYPGSVGMELAGLMGSVETPALYPAGTQVLDVPQAFHTVPGRPVDGCSSVYPEPAESSPYTDAVAFVDAYGKSVADTAVAALASSRVVVVDPTDLLGQRRSVCVQLENDFFAAAFAAGLFPDRPVFLDPACTVGLSVAGRASLGPAGQPTTPHPAVPLYLSTDVGVLTVGPAQITYSPGEVFPFTEIGGPVDRAQMPFPTDCYRPSPSAPTDPRAGTYTCGTPLPMTANIAAAMTRPYRYLAGLGEDMIGYLFPPGNFVGSQGETAEAPWAVYENTASTGHDRFGYPHADDAESVGPHAGAAVTSALADLLSRDGKGLTVVPGLFVDAAGRLCDSPFPASGSWVAGCGSFSGAIGVRVFGRTLVVGTRGVTGWATYLGTVDDGTAGTSLPYSTATRGVMVAGRPVLIDVYGATLAGGS